ncbi:hypothetical protein QQ054_07125 [Oscillatoria amoena NRMC-F 0135]|nr:hypothetical protein [Oscillatoria amoena NRMC-F 0135]
MSDKAHPHQSSIPEGRSVQSYIDETPFWADNTEVNFTPMTVMQWRIWILATAGKFFEGLVVFMTGVALPLIVLEFNLGAAEKGPSPPPPCAAFSSGRHCWAVLPIISGAKPMFIAEMALFCLFLV